MKLILTTLLVLSFAASGLTQTSATRTKHFNLEDGIALQGYDPVAYLLQQKALQGKSNLSHKHEGITYYFATAKNLDTFKKNPQEFEPMYGGWCAYAMGVSGKKVEVDPETFKVVDGKLYLFYNKYFNNTLPKWNENQDELMKKADANWREFLPAK